MSKPTDRQLKLTALALGELSPHEAEELLQSLTPEESAQLDADRQLATMLSNELQQTVQTALSAEHHNAIERALSEMDEQVLAPAAKRTSQTVLHFPRKLKRQWLRPAATVLVSAAALLVAVVVTQVAVQNHTQTLTVPTSAPSAESPPSPTPLALPFDEPAMVPQGGRPTTPDWYAQSTTLVPVQSAKHSRRRRLRSVRNDEARRSVPDAAPASPRMVPMSSKAQRHRRKDAIETSTRRLAPPSPPPTVPVQENEFQSVKEHPVTTLAIDVDTAAYSNIRRQIDLGRLPDPRGVRLEEMVNYFTYELPPPDGEHPISVVADVTDAPWNPKHLLARIALNSRAPQGDRKRANIVLLVDVSGSMASRNKLPLLQRALRVLAGSFTAEDRIAIVTYADNARVVLPSVPGNRTDVIINAIDALKADGSTNGALGLKQAYQVANEQRFAHGINRVVVATDGDFNTGETGQKEITAMVRAEAGRSVFMTVLGFGNDLNDSFLERLADRSNGHYAMIDSEREAEKVLKQQLTSTLEVVAKDVKVQLELNPRRIEKYRLLGYENRKLDNDDFGDDTVDGGEMGAGHAVTMLYELVPRSTGPTEERVYQPVAPSTDVDVENDLLMVNVRYKTPHGRRSRSFRRSVHAWKEHLAASHDTRFAAAVAGFGLLLIDSQHKGDLEYDDVIQLAQGAVGDDPKKWRQQFVSLVRRAQALQRSGARRRRPPSGATITERQIHQFISSKRTAASQCLQKALKQGDRPPTGKIEIDVLLRSRGQCSASIRTSRFRDTAVGECLRQLFDGHCYPGYRGPDETIVVPFVLQSPGVTQFQLQDPTTTDTGAPRHQLNDSDVLAVLRKHKAGIRACLKEQRLADPTLEGTMTVAFVVMNSGVPKRIRVSPARFIQSVAGRCVVETMSKWRFPKFDGPHMPIDFPISVRRR